MPDILVRQVPKETVDALKRQAEEHGRSLQQEVKIILQTAGKRRHIADYVENARRMRERIASYAPNQTDSTALTRSDRGLLGGR